MANIICNDCDKSRREFLRSGFFGIGVGLAMPLVFERASLAIAAESFLESKETHPERILVVVEMAGGNDGLNTVIPFRNDIYYKARPALAVRAADVLKLNDEIGLHTSMTGFKSIWDQGKLAIVQGCGYPNPNRSHFTSMEYWHTAVPNGAESLGWVGRFADASWPKGEPNKIVNVAERQSLAVQAIRNAPVVFADPNRFVRAGDTSQEPVYKNVLDRQSEQPNKTLSFLREISRTAADSSAKVREAASGYKTTISYGSESSVSSLAPDLKKVAALINAGFGTRVYYVSMGGFDTHSGQAGTQQQLLMYVADALEGFLKDVRRIGRGSDVAVMMFTEFGRRVSQNQSGGTDHGTATPMYILGDKVKGGLYGSYPSLEKLDSNGDLIMTTDFRSVYATMIGEWMGYPDTRTILRGDFPALGAFGAG
jgi:uncharacterized protein (DUF1501 family)